MGEQIWLLAALMAAAAALYGSVGHGGASAYLALMALFAVAPDVMRPTALTLNIVVASMGAVRFIRAGAFAWQAFWPFAVAAIPMAWLTGGLDVPEALFRPLLALALLAAAARYLLAPKRDAEKAVRAPAPLVALPVGAALGALSGLTGVGGGIYLSPLLVFFAWATPRQSAGIAATFIVCNSAAGLLGQARRLEALPPELPILAGAVALGGLLGVSLSIHAFTANILLRALGLVLLIAGFKLVLT